MPSGLPVPGTCLVRTEACLTKPWGAAPAPPNLPGLARAPEAQAWPEMVRQARWNAVPRRAPGKPPKVSLPEPRLLPGARWAWGGPSLLGSSALSEGQGLESHMRAGSWGAGGLGMAGRRVVSRGKRAQPRGAPWQTGEGEGGLPCLGQGLGPGKGSAGRGPGRESSLTLTPLLPAAPWSPGGRAGP